MNECALLSWHLHKAHSTLGFQMQHDCTMEEREAVRVDILTEVAWTQVTLHDAFGRPFVFYTVPLMDLGCAAVFDRMKSLDTPDSYLVSLAEQRHSPLILDKTATVVRSTVVPKEARRFYENGFYAQL